MTQRDSHDDYDDGSYDDYEVDLHYDSYQVDLRYDNYQNNQVTRNYQVDLHYDDYRNNQVTNNLYHVGHQDNTYVTYLGPRATYHGPKRDYRHYLDDTTKVFTRDIVLIWQHTRPEQYPPLFKERTKILIFRSTGINLEINNLEESTKGNKHKTWIRNLNLQDAKIILSKLKENGLCVSQILAKVDRAFDFIKEELTEKILSKPGFDLVNDWEYEKILQPTIMRV